MPITWLRFIVSCFDRFIPIFHRSIINVWKNASRYVRNYGYWRLPITLCTAPFAPLLKELCEIRDVHYFNGYPRRLYKRASSPSGLSDCRFALPCIGLLSKMQWNALFAEFLRFDPSVCYLHCMLLHTIKAWISMQFPYFPFDFQLLFYTFYLNRYWRYGTDESLDLIVWCGCDNISVYK